MLAFALKHLKWILPVIAVAGLAGYAAWEHHEANRAQSALASYQQTEHGATLAVKAAQAQADATSAAQKLALIQQRDKEIATLKQSQAAQAVKSGKLRSALRAIYTRSAAAQNWRETPIPASVRAAIRAEGGS